MGFTLIFSAAGEKILGIYTVYTRDLHRFLAPQVRFFLETYAAYTRDLYRFWSAAGEKISGTYTAYTKGFTLILARRRREIFYNLHRLHKRLISILGRRRRKNYTIMSLVESNCTIIEDFYQFSHIARHRFSGETH